MKKKLQGILRKSVWAAGIGTVGFAVAWMAFPFEQERIADYPEGAVLRDRAGNILRRTLSASEMDCLPVDLAMSGSWTGKAIIAAEDKRFYRHAGIDPVAVLRSSAYNLYNLRVVTGASTISTQVIRMAEPRRRNLPTKAIEAFRALQMEQVVEKGEILEQYLNRAPMGGNLHGVESASRRYFDKPASELSLGEASLLMGLPQSPSRFRPDRHLDRAVERRGYVLDKMLAQGTITVVQKERAESQPLNVHWHDAPFRAPHFCDWMLQQGALQGDVQTTLDPDIQAIAEQCNQRGAIVVLEVATGAIRAMSGSPDYFDAVNQGQVNGAVAARSPGSTLKPFAYALAMEQGRITPETLLNDTQLVFKNYTPSNFDRQFQGAVSARHALVQSLNIPALQVVRKTGLPAFYALLQELGLESIDQPADHYGLSLVLGTCEARLLELANAYATLARGGVYQPVRPFEGESAVAARRIFSEGTSYLVTDMLSGDERRLASGSHEGVRVAWKTGTSNGYRDAWTLAYNPAYVVGVWVGRPDGSPSEDFVGIKSAAPVAHQVFRALYPSGEGPWFSRPDSVVQRSVCTETGAAAGPRCGATRSGLYIRGQSAATPCAHRVVAQELTILSPPPEAKYVLADGDGRWDASIPLRAHAEEGAQLFWFVNGQRYASASWALKTGRHVFRCVDESGRSAHATVTVY